MAREFGIMQHRLKRSPPFGHFSRIAILGGDWLWLEIVRLVVRSRSRQGSRLFGDPLAVFLSILEGGPSLVSKLLKRANKILVRLWGAKKGRRLGLGSRTFPLSSAVRAVLLKPVTRKEPNHWHYRVGTGGSLSLSDIRLPRIHRPLAFFAKRGKVSIGMAESMAPHSIFVSETSSNYGGIGRGRDSEQGQL